MIAAIPNIITGLRFFLVIPISISIYEGKDFLALILFVVAGLSDGLDGYLARKFDWCSDFGQFADPLADKCLIVATLLAFAFSEKLPLANHSIQFSPWYLFRRMQFLRGPIEKLDFDDF